MTGAVLDSSALLALLLNEPGAQVVTCVLDDALILSVNFAEVVGYYAKKGIDPAAIRSVLTSLPVRVVPFDQDLAYETGRTRPMCEKAGLSLGDRACLALAKHEGSPVYSADRAWATVAEEYGVAVVLIR